MALVLKNLYNGYFWIFEEVADPRANDYPFMGSIFPLLIIVTLWLKFIFHWGPEFMKHKEPYDLRKILIIFNLIQILANGFIVFEGFRVIEYLNWDCAEIDYTEGGRHLLSMTYFYHIIKVVDLLDTVFFVLRKKQNQVSFLHVYHHFGMAVLTWIGVKFVGGGHSCYIGFVNAMVHVLMYTYYLLAAYDPSYKKIIWAKKFITQMQLAQFLFLLYAFGKLLFNKECKYPKVISYFFVPQNLFISSLFLDFYIRTYIWPTKKSKGGNEE